MRVATKREDIGFWVRGRVDEECEPKEMHMGSDGKQHGEGESCEPCEKGRWSGWTTGGPRKKTRGGAGNVGKLRNIRWGTCV